MKQFTIFIAFLALAPTFYGQDLVCTTGCANPTDFYLDIDGDEFGVNDALTNKSCCNVSLEMYSTTPGDGCPFDSSKQVVDPNCACGTVCDGVLGCVYYEACNYNAQATINDGSCVFPLACQNCLVISPKVVDGTGEVNPAGPCSCDEDNPSSPLGYRDALGNCFGSSEPGYCAADADNDGVCDDNGNDPCLVAGEELDECGVCGGTGVDVDNDGICDLDIDGSVLDNCTDVLACNYLGFLGSGSSVTFNPACLFDDDCGVCGGTGVDVDPANGICDDLDIEGCMDGTKCNYNSLAVRSDDSCIDDVDACGVCGGPGVPTGACVDTTDPLICYYYPEEFRDCDGFCINNSDSDSTVALEQVCDEEEVTGCMNAEACNYDPAATDVGSCILKDISGVCGGTCLVDFDEDGICDDNGNDPCVGVIDDCGVCNGSSLNGVLPAGKCDCFDHVLDALDVCGGTCLVDDDNDGICDDNGGDPIICNGVPDAAGVCNGSCLVDEDGDGVCDDNGGDPCVGIIDACGVCAGPGMPVGDCDCAGHQLDESGVCGGACQVDADDDGICDDNGNDPCVGVIDDCGVCNGSSLNGVLPEGKCDCFGNEEDAAGVCGGNCLSDPDGDDICDLDEDGNVKDTCDGSLDECGVCEGPGSLTDCGCSASLAGFCDCDGHVLDDCGVCGGDGPEFGYDCAGICLSDTNLNGICDALEEVLLIPRLVVHYDNAKNPVSVSPFVLQSTNDSLEHLLRLMTANLDDGSLTGSSENMTLEESILINGTLRVEGASDFGSDVEMKRNMDVNGNILIKGNADILGTTFSNGGIKTSELEMSGEMGVGGNLSVVSGLIVAGETQIKSTLDLRGDFIIHQGNTGGEMSATHVFDISSATGATYALGRIQTNGSLDVDGISTFGRLDVTGESVLKHLTVSGLFDLNANADIEGNFRVANDKFVTSAESKNTSIAASGDLIVAKNLLVSGNIDIGGSCTIEGVTFSNGGMETTSMTMSGNLTVGGSASTGWDLNVYGDGTFGQKFSAGGDFTVYKGSTATWNTVLGNPATFNSNTLFSASSSTGDVYAQKRWESQSVTMSGNSSFLNDLIIAASLNGNGRVDLTGDLTVLSNSIFTGAADIRNINANNFNVTTTTTVTGDVSFEGGLKVSGATTTDKITIGTAASPTASSTLRVSSDEVTTATFTNNSGSANQGGIEIQLGNMTPANAQNFMSFQNGADVVMGRIEGVRVRYENSGEIASTNELMDDGGYVLELAFLDQDKKTANEGVTSAGIGYANAALDLALIVAEIIADGAAVTGCVGIVFYGPFPAPFFAACPPPPSFGIADAAPAILAAANLIIAGAALDESTVSVTNAESLKDQFKAAVLGDMQSLSSSTGLVTNSGNHYKVGVTYQSGAGDYAEWLPRENPHADYEPGQVVGVKNGMISLNTAGADNLFVISTQPVVLGNMPQGNTARYEKAAFLGQVPVRVLGRVNSGDYILASGNHDGFAVAIHPEKLSPNDLERVVGVAWESGNHPYKNVVNCSVGLPGTSADLFSEMQNRTDALQKKSEGLQDLILAWASGDDDLNKADAMQSGLIPTPVVLTGEEIDWTTASIDDVSIRQISPEAIRLAMDDAILMMGGYGMTAEKSAIYGKLRNGDQELRGLIERTIAQKLNEYNEMAVQAIVDFEGKEATRVRIASPKGDSTSPKAAPEREIKRNKWSFKQWGGKR